MIYLVRHGQTLFNAEGRLQGRLDSPLTDKGRRQAEAVGAGLRETLGAGLEDIVLESSPQGRARATAAIIGSALGDERAARVDDRLREISLGAWEGLTVVDIETRWPGAWRGTVRESWAEGCPDGESYEAAESRLAAWLRDADKDDARIAVSHGVAIGILLGLHQGLSRAATLATTTPQGTIFVLAPGAVETVACV